MSEQIRHETDYERSDASPRLIALLLAVIAATIVLSIVVLGIAYRGAIERPAATPSVLPPQPRLLIHEHADLQRFRQAVERRLDSYGWVDRGRGIVHIPINVAIRLAAQKGFPDWPGNPR